MMSAKRAVYGAMVCLSVALGAGMARAQSKDDGEVSLHLVAEGAMERGTLPVSYRIFGRPTALKIGVVFGNRSENLIMVDQDMLRGAVRVRMTMGTEQIPVATTWIPEIRMVDEWIPTPTSAGLIPVQPHTNVTWFLTIEREDGLPFERASHWLGWEVPGLHATVTKPDGARWVGRSPGLVGRTELIVSPPETARDVSSMHKANALDALLRKNYAVAASAYAQAAAADPTDDSARGGLAGALMNLKRYAEAISIYERLAASQPPSSLLQAALAMAYLGNGDEPNARRVLLASGLAPDKLNEKVQELRDNNRRR